MRDRDTSMLQITVKTRNSENNVDLLKDLKIYEEDINHDFCEQPAKFAWWSTVAAQAQALVDRKKLEIEQQEEYLKKTLMGELDAEVRQELEMNGEKITETKVTNGIYIHPRYNEHKEILYELKKELLELQENSTILNIAKEAMIQRKDALISLGAQLRTEASNLDMKIMQEKAREIVGGRKNNK